MCFEKTKEIKKRKYNIKLISVFVLFAIIFGSISIVNHYQLRTCALDFGMFNHAIFNFSHFKQAYYTLGISGKEMLFLGTHFSLITILFSPFYYLFGSYTLLIIQIFAILMGGLASYKYAKFKFDDNSIIPFIVCIHFFSIWGIYSALSVGFHNNVIGAMLVMWFIYYLEKRKLIYSFIFLILILFCKEVMAIWLFFVIIGLMIKNRKKYSKEYIKFEIPAAVFCIVYGVIVIFFVMPLLQGVNSNLQFSRYSYLGSSIVEIFSNIIHNPSYFVSIFFRNTLPDNLYSGIKLETYLMILASGGILLFFRPVYLLMMIPLFAQKFLSNNYGFWGINGQYSIEFVPILSLILIDFIQSVKKYKKQKIIAIGITLLTLFMSFSKLENRTSKWYDKTNTVFYNKRHYQPNLNLSKIYKAIRYIPEDEIISVSSCLAPHLAFREKIYHFPIVKNAKYIILICKKRSTYPLVKNDFAREVNKYRNSKIFEIVYDNYNLLILRKKNISFLEYSG
ncbi:MAG: DUF2079 domain-containing protein [Bacteroidetes bacterium]|nr:DUF2079 domain-containing protein [Bacteroidota bacterium]